MVSSQTGQTMTSYRLTYFDAKGRAEVTRLLFTLAGQDFDDVRVSMTDWPKVKPSTPFGQLPTLVIDGQTFAQSCAINIYLAKEFGYYGRTNTERLQTDQILGLLADFTSAFIHAAFDEDETDIRVKDQIEPEFRETVAPRYMALLENLLKENGTGYFVGSSLTLADLAVFDTLDSCRWIGLTWIDDHCPHIQALVKRVAGIDRLKQYIASRKATVF